MLSTIPRDRQVDGLPASHGHAPAGKEFRPDVQGRVAVSVGGVSAIPAAKLALGSAVGAMLEAAPAARLARVPRVNPLDPDAACFRLVGKKRPEGGKRPAMQAALPPVDAIGSHPRANVRQVLDGDRRPFRGKVNHPSTDDVVVVTTTARGSPRQLLEVPFGVLRPALLQGATQAEVPRFQFPPAALAVEGGQRRDRCARDAEIDANHDVVRFGLRCWNCHNDVQPPAPTPLHQISGIRGALRVPLSVAWEAKAKSLPPSSGREVHRAALPIDAEGVPVVARWTEARLRAGGSASLSLPCQRRPHGLGRFHPRLNVQIAPSAGWSAFSG